MNLLFFVRYKTLCLFAGVAALTCCLVQGKQYRTSEQQDRSCLINDDCKLREECLDGWCRPAVDCNACVEVPHGTPICFHGACLLGACEEGWHDADEDYRTGCEYECQPTHGGIERCDHVDNDCDKHIDEDFDLMTDVMNCGECERECPVPLHAQPLCAGGECYFLCEPGWYDNDWEPDNGCEADHCEVTAGGEELCDLRDNDCDGEVDEGMVKDTPESCGPLCHECIFDHAEDLCEDQRCVMGACDSEYHDLNHDVSDGCEYHCVVTNGGVEICDDLDNDCNGLTDEGLVCSCPEGMVPVESLFCVDIYEASRPDATATEEGNATGAAHSVPGVMSWRRASLQVASAACQAAGKRLCYPEEWEQACRGPDWNEYSYGDTYDPVICNGIDTFCECGPGSGCEDQDPCPFAQCWAFPCETQPHPMPTSSFPQCTNAYGVYDINGNVWEMVQGNRGRGGAYNCTNSEILHRCSSEKDPASGISNIGFRCCCVQCP